MESDLTDGAPGKSAFAAGLFSVDRVLNQASSGHDVPEAV